MNIVQATEAYEAWVGQLTPLIPQDLALKHQRMSEGLFPFLRATFYRWMQLWPQVCPELAKAPAVLAVGDLHVENFGTWRDAEGRLVWGVNDFDEVHPLAWPLDLVRLAASALLAIQEEGLKLAGKDACAAILAGYAEGLAAGGKPLVLEDDNRWLRDVAQSELRDPVKYWKKLDGLETWTQTIPDPVPKMLLQTLPAGCKHPRIVHRVAGLGSLGRQRFTALGQWFGGKVAREAKALTPSACVWAAAHPTLAQIHYKEAVSRAVRCPDLSLHVHGAWLLRRLAPDCSRIELATLPKKRDETRILQSMGWETANIHLGSPALIAPVVASLGRQKAGWLKAAARAMIEALTRDWEEWKSAFHPQQAAKTH